MSIRSRFSFTTVGVAASVALLAVLGLAGCATTTAPPEQKDAPIADAASVPTGVVDNAFQLGDGPVVIEIYTDASCPHCQIFDAASSDALAARLAAGDVTLRIHPINYVSAKHGDATEFSTRVMNLLAAVSDSGQVAKVPAVYSAALAVLPSDEATPAPDDAALLRIAEQAGVNLTADVKSAVESGRWNAWVQRVNDAAMGMPIADSGVILQYVPTVVVSNRQLEIREDGTDLARLQQLIDAAK